MAYQVRITAAAKKNLRDARDWVAQHAPETANEWLHRFETAINTLADFPR